MKSSLKFCQFVENFGLSPRQFSSLFIFSQFIISYVVEQIFFLSNVMVASLSLFYNGVFIL